MPENGAVRAVIQRVTRARVVVAGETVGELTEPGLVILLGIAHGDTESTADAFAMKIHQLRILDDASAAELGAPLLVVSQFTIFADTSRGRRPSWTHAAPREVAEPLVDAFTAALRRRGALVETGAFGAHMELELVNDGPYTVVLDS